jgi:hypothetical protein
MLTNIRELKNIVERALIESQGQDIGPEHLPLAPVGSSSAAPPTLEEAADAMPLNFGDAELALIERAVRQTGGNIAGAAFGRGADQGLPAVEGGGAVGGLSVVDVALYVFRMNCLVLTEM